MQKLLIKIVSIALSLTLVSCGDLFTKHLPEKELSIEGLANCEINTESLTKILQKNIKGDLVCLQSYLTFFASVVEKEKGAKPGSLSYKELVKYIKKEMKEVDSSTLVALEALFDLSKLLFGDDTGFIAGSNIPKLMKVMIYFNEYAVEGKLYEYFVDEKKVDFHEHNKRKSQIYSSMVQIKKVLKTEFEASSKVISLPDFLRKFKGVGGDEVIETANSLIFLKRAILGGDQNMLTAKEFSRAIDMLPDVMKITFDFINIPDTTSDGAYEDEEILKILKEDVEAVKKNFYFNAQTDADAVLFKYEDLQAVVKHFFPEYLHYTEYKETILTLKESILGDPSEYFYASEMMVLLDEILEKNLSKGLNFYKFYNQNKSEMDASSILVRNFNLQHYIDLTTERAHMKEFNRIAQQYRYYLGHEFSPMYDFAYIRNPRGLVQIALIEDIAARIFKKHGAPNASAVGGYSMTLEQLEVLMVKLGEMLEGEGLVVEGRVKSTAETITLMSSLFHHQSDGDEFIEVNEFTEFAVTMLTSLNLSSRMYNNFKYLFAESKRQGDTDCEVSPDGRYPGQCFRDFMLKFLDSDFKIDSDGVKETTTPISSYFPEMKEYLTSLSPEDFQSYFEKTAKFSRTCSTFDTGEERDMEETDGIVTWAGLIAVEQSMLRFDVDKSGVLEPNEIDEAYVIYESAIKALTPDFLQGRAKRIFQYMIKYKKVPQIPEFKGSIWQKAKQAWQAAKAGVPMLKFLYLTRYNNRVANADRMTFAAVLEIIAENSPAALENPFDCETLRR